MATAYQHRPLSKILAPNADDVEDKSQTPESDKNKTNGADNDKGQLPEKFKGKSPEEIVESYSNLEKEVGRLRNELGTYRGLVTELSSLQRKPTDSQTTDQEPSVDVSGDDLVNDPVGSVRKIVQHDMSKAEIERKERDLEAQVNAETERLLNDYGNLADVVQTEDFQKFASRTQSRKDDFQRAAYGEGMEQVRAARRLLEDYSDYKELEKTYKGNSSNDNADDGVKAARKASTEGGGNAGKVTSDKKYKESEVLKVIETDPDKWRSPSYQREVLKAIKEGRFIKDA